MKGPTVLLSSLCLFLTPFSGYFVNRITGLANDSMCLSMAIAVIELQKVG